MSAHVPSRGIDNLENRLLLASFATLNSHGTLSVADTPGDDLISVSYAQFFDIKEVEVNRNGDDIRFLRDDVKRIYIVGGHGNDVFGTNVAVPVTMLGGDGDDSLGTAFIAPPALLVGGPGNDILAGTSSNDTIDAGGGNDTLQGNGGDDLLIGGLGSDTFHGNDGHDTADYSAQRKAFAHIGQQSQRRRGRRK